MTGILNSKHLLSVIFLSFSPFLCAVFSSETVIRLRMYSLFEIYAEKKPVFNNMKQLEQYRILMKILQLKSEANS